MRELRKRINGRTASDNLWKPATGSKSGHCKINKKTRADRSHSRQVETEGETISSPLKVPARKPPKFSYVVEGLLAGMGRPAQHGHVQYLCDLKFSYLVSLTENKPRAVAQYPGAGLEWVHIPVPDEKPPTLEQIIKFVDLVEKARKEGKSVAVHCAWGRGRTGTLLACYLIFDNLRKTGVLLSTDEGVARIRELRPQSVDTEKQKNSIDCYVEYLKGQSSSHV